MLLSEPVLPTISYTQFDGSFQQFSSPRLRSSDHFYHSTQTSPYSGSSELDFDDSSVQSISSSPSSTQSFPVYYTAVSQRSLGGLDSNPTLAVPRGYTQHPTTYLKFPSDAPSLFEQPDLMHADSTWMSNGQLTPSAGRFSQHNRESSLSSLGSAGPSSPYVHNSSNSQVTVVDEESFHGLHDYTNYQLANNNTKQFYADTFTPNYPNYASVDTTSNNNYSQQNMAATRHQKGERGMFSMSDNTGSQQQQQQQQQSRPKPVTLASVKSSDSANTATGEGDGSGRGRNISFKAIPKLDRTMTDIYSDELFNPHFTVTSAPPSQSMVSPSNNELFTQRLLAANSQHLSVHSPVSASSGGSPFRQGSPLAPAPSHDFSSAPGPSAPMVFGSQQQLREQAKAVQDAQAMQQQLAQDSDNSAPQTISPKDALIEYQSPEGENNFPLFPQQQQQQPQQQQQQQQQQHQDFKMEQMPEVSQSSQSLSNFAIDDQAFAFSASQLPHMGTQQQYSFPQQTSQLQQLQAGNAALSASSRPSSVESEISMSSYASNVPIQRPAGTMADGGTYTCTYHGCTLRFDTPALLQKHKREGHRSTHGITGRTELPTSGSRAPSLPTTLNTQAGPHKCERINPSTGKPCNIMFSRPYDLTRHEDTIHNARKQKVRCNLCTDEKSFSRADALTRHYRVCHPHVEFPGKHRRRGGQSG